MIAPIRHVMANEYSTDSKLTIITNIMQNMNWFHPTSTDKFLLK